MAITALTPPTAVAPFDALADVYDDVFTESLIGRAQRRAVWRELDLVFHSGQRILELNCGTGVDAIHLAQRGVSVVACDASARMITMARARLAKCDPAVRVEFCEIRTEEISRIENEGPFDGAFSNFSGLNCVRDLRQVAEDLGRLLRPRAPLLLCLFGRFVPWEILWYLAKAKPKKAVRRFGRSKAAGELADGVRVPVYYHSIREVARAFAPMFRLAEWSGIGITVPPSYVEPWARHCPAALRVLGRMDCRLSRWPVFRSLADHTLLRFERTES